jgi:hypothetical protein
MLETPEDDFTAQVIDFDLVAAMEDKLPRASFGKGSVQV